MSGVLTDTSILAGAAGAVSGYNIDNSCRFSNPGITDGNPGTSRLTNTFGTPTNNKLWTMSLWAKRAYLGSDYGTTGVGVTSSKRFFGAKPTSGATAFHCGFEEDNNLVFRYWDATDTQYSLKSTARYRDVGAWYHCVFQMNTAHATSTERMKIWVNGVQVTDFSTSAYPPQNNLPGWNEANFVAIVGGVVGNANTPTYEYGFDGLLTEIHFIDGQGLTAADFGETDEDTNEWKAIEYTGTYGNNGFYFEFKDSGALGTDTSGEGNNWTPADIAATDQMIDTPQNSTGSNFCTMNSLAQLPSANATTFLVTRANLRTEATGGGQEVTGTLMPLSGKWYFEMYLQNLASNVEQFGITRTSSVLGSTYLEGVNYRTDGDKFVDGTSSAYGATWTTGDLMAAAVDIDANSITFYKNNASQGAISYASGYHMIPMVRMGANGNVAVFNFGQDGSFSGQKTAQGNSDANGNGDFYYTPPAGYLALCSDNLPDPLISGVDAPLNFNTILRNGTGSSGGSFTGVGFSPDFLWQKSRNVSANHWLNDTPRGSSKYLWSNSNNAEGTDATFLASFDADGFTMGANDWGTSTTVVAWNWKAGGTPTADNDNTTGAMDANSVALNGSLQAAYTPSGSPSIYPKKMSINTISGFSIIEYTSPGTNSDETIPHGLSQRPDMVIVKNLDATRNWDVWTPDLSSGYDLRLNTTDAEASGRWPTTIPTASLVTLKDDYEVEESNEFIAYCFHNIEGYSKVGVYYGNDSANGPFIYTNFTPAFLIVKAIGQAGQGWIMSDNKRSPYNAVGNYLYAQNDTAEQVDASGNFDFVSNGFKLRDNSYNNNHPGGMDFLYYAIAESPFKTSNAR